MTNDSFFNNLILDRKQFIDDMKYYLFNDEIRMIKNKENESLKIHNEKT